jgi:D-3-phosphoglycerate dehydrogenase
MKSFQAIRVNLSPYQHPDFSRWEKNLLEELPGISYRELNSRDPDQDIVLITNTHTCLSELPQDVLVKTRLILHPNSGYDHFASDKKIWENISTVIGHEIRAQAVAEYTIGCLFQGLLDLPQHLSWNKTRRWERSLLKDQDILIVGFGHIGKIVAQTLSALEMKITLIDPYIESAPFPLFKSWREVDLKKMRATLVCSSLNSTSRKLFDEEFFSEVNEELLFINGARGPLVDEAALKNYLRLNPKAFAFLDVFEEEPFKEEWLSFPQVWKTSHIAGVYQELDQGILRFERKVLEDFLNMSEKSFTEKYRQELLQFKWIKGELI